MSNSVITFVAFITVIAAIPVTIYTFIKLAEAFETSDYIKALFPAVLWILWTVFSCS